MEIKKNCFLFIFFSGCIGFAQLETDTSKVGLTEVHKIFGLDNEAIFELKGRELPKFELPTIDGQKKSSNSLEGKPTLINFWFDGCAPCIEEIPILNEIKSAIGDDVNFIAITFQDKDRVSKFLERKDFPFTHLVSAGDYLNSFGLFGYPKTLVLDENLVVMEIEKMIPKDPSNKQKNIEDFKGRIIGTLTELNEQ